MDLLVVFANRPGEVLSREELEATVWQGTVVGYDALSSAIIKLRKAIEDDPKHPRIIETIPKKGYRLVAEVFIPPEATPNVSVTSKPISIFTQNPVHLAASVTLVLLLSITVLIVWQNRQSIWVDSAKTSTVSVSAPLPDKPSIAVLPFTNLSDDPEQDYFSDGLTEDLITDLSKISSLLVISRNSVFTYKGSPLKTRDVARELGVRYMLEGSVRKSGDRVRITAQLIDATSEFHMWAERFDRELKDIFALQDEVNAKIIDSLKVKLTTGERKSLVGRYTDSIEAYDYFLQGRDYLWRRSKETNLTARGFFEKAIELDPNFARAYSDLARTHAREVIDGWTDSPQYSLEHAQQLALKAIALDPKQAQAHFNISIVHLYRKAHKDAVLAAEKAILLDPNYADAYVQLAAILTYAGMPEKALALVEKAIRLNPHYPLGYARVLGYAHFTQGRYQAAIEGFTRAIERNPGAQRTHMWLAASYALSGQLEEAQWEVQEVLALDPEFSLTRISQAVPYKDPAHLERLVDALRKAGLPE